ncbi:YqaH family protein [Rummeliibacillus sp. NPDC094406]|uniref:YqaH family protein n=1 Tax=Rummeliibacillus sp. NPDC094406 TaxID=3364511 RepID=UPI00380094A4
MNRLDFRIQDWPAAEREYNCIDSLQKELTICIERNNFATAELCAEDIISSIKEIRRMQKAKQEHDRLVEMVEMMKREGINLSVVAR